MTLTGFAFFHVRSMMPIRMPAKWGSLANFTTTINTYVLVGAAFEVIQYKTKKFAFIVTTNNLHVQVQGSMDGGTTWITQENDIACNVGSTYKTYTEPFTHMQINVKPAVAATHGTLATRWLGASW